MALRLIAFILFMYVADSLQYVVPNLRYRQLPQARLSLAEFNSYDVRDHEGPGTYAFGYDYEDPQTGNTQFREEERYPNGTVVGSYGYVEADGNVHVVHYVADENGYRARIEDSRDKIPVAGPKYQQPKPQIRYTNTANYNQPIRRNYENRVIVPQQNLIPPIRQNDYNPYNQYSDNIAISSNQRYTNIPQNNALYYNLNY